MQLSPSGPERTLAGPPNKLENLWRHVHGQATGAAGPPAADTESAQSTTQNAPLGSFGEQV
eukprot:7548814-Alexandrium_andersonii.AAC.1